jgi:hypothetical protein
VFDDQSLANANQLIEYYSSSNFTATILFIIEFCQILHFVFDPTMDYLWNNQVAQVGFSILRYTQLTILIESSNIAWKLIIFFLIFALLSSLQVYFMCYGFLWNTTNRINSTGLKNLERFLVWIKIALNTIFTIPVFQILLNMMICIEGSRYSQGVTQCYTGYRVATLIFGIICFIMLAKEAYFLCYLLNDQDPFKRNPFSFPSSTMLMVRFIAKFVLTLFSILDSYVGWVLIRAHIECIWRSSECFCSQ